MIYSFDCLFFHQWFQNPIQPEVKKFKCYLRDGWLTLTPVSEGNKEESLIISKEKNRCSTY